MSETKAAVEDTAAEVPQESGATPEAGAMPDPQAQPQGQGATPATGSTATDTLGAEGIAALKREREQRKALERQLAEAEAAKKAEVGTLAQRVADLEESAAKARREALLATVADKVGVPLALAQRLRLDGDDEEAMRRELEAVAESLPARPGRSVGGPQGASAGSRSPEDWVKVLRERSHMT